MQHPTLLGALALGDAIRDLLQNPERDALYSRIGHQNAWFTTENLEHALSHWASLLQEAPLIAWWEAESIVKTPVLKKIGIVMAGNIPLVGLHDLLAVWITGHHAVVKCASNDDILLPYLVKKATEKQPSLTENITWAEKLTDADAVIATGSDNTARYFKQYFGHLPHIIRKNRNSLAIISGFESDEALAPLKEDLIRYFGLGCRSVSHVLIPEDFDPTRIIKLLDNELSLVHHHKYFNNFEYHYAIHLLNRTPHYTNNVVLMTESDSLASPLGMLHYSRYSTRASLDEKIKAWGDQIQVTVSADSWFPGSIPFGTSQQPGLTTYADGVNTISWLLGLQDTSHQS